VLNALSPAGVFIYTYKETSRDNPNIHGTLTLTMYSNGNEIIRKSTNTIINAPIEAVNFG
jgi:2-keto-4-pentenoate hydratase/2-oxohepta-3-ene-1,7-dioic acid hydratase in catechol pathway